MRTRHLTHVLTTPKTLRCLDCGTRIHRAACEEGWCCDCIGSEGMGSAGFLMDSTRPYFCKPHRTRVRIDDHCRQWSADN